MRSWVMGVLAVCLGGAVVLGADLVATRPVGTSSAPSTTTRPDVRLRDIPGELNLDVTTRAAEPGKDPLPFVAGSWTLAVIPDVQHYNNAKYAKIYHRQQSMMKWLVAHKEARNIKFAITTGDITDHDLDSEWVKAREAFSILDGKLPYVMVTGNHDYADHKNRGGLINNHFKIEQNPLNDPAKGGALGGTWKEGGGIENAWYKFEIGGQKYVVLTLEWAPRDGAVKWGEEVVKSNPDARVIFITHAYLNNDDKRYDWAKYGKKQQYSPHNYATRSPTDASLNDGEELWQKFVRKHSNILIVINGHVLGDQLAYLASTGDHGNVVHQMLYNRQNNDDGQMRLLEFLPDGKTVQVKTYSPVTGAWARDVQNEYLMDLKPGSEAAATRHSTVYKMKGK